MDWNKTIQKLNPHEVIKKPGNAIHDITEYELGRICRFLWKKIISIISIALKANEKCIRHAREKECEWKRKNSILCMSLSVFAYYPTTTRRPLSCETRACLMFRHKGQKGRPRRRLERSTRRKSRVSAFHSRGTKEPWRERGEKTLRNVFCEKGLTLQPTSMDVCQVPLKQKKWGNWMAEWEF